MRALLVFFLLVVSGNLLAQETATVPFQRCNQIKVKVENGRSDDETLRYIVSILADHNFDIRKYIPEIGYVKSGIRGDAEYAFTVVNGLVTIHGNVLDDTGNYSFKVSYSKISLGSGAFDRMNEFAHLLGSEISYLRID